MHVDLWVRLHKASSDVEVLMFLRFKHPGRDKKVPEVVAITKCYTVSGVRGRPAHGVGPVADYLPVAFPRVAKVVRVGVFRARHTQGYHSCPRCLDEFQHPGSLPGQDGVACVPHGVVTDDLQAGGLSLVEGCLKELLGWQGQNLLEVEAQELLNLAAPVDEAPNLGDEDASGPDVGQKELVAVGIQT